MPDSRIPELTAALDRACRAAGFDDYMPSQMIGHFVRQVVPASLDGDRFNLNQFYQWTRQEYSIPDSAFGRAFNQFGPEAARLGVTAVEPEGFDPGFGETIRSWLIGAVDGNKDHAVAATAAPQIPIAPLPSETLILPPDYELQSEPVRYGEPVTDATASYAEPFAEEAVPVPLEDAEAADDQVTYGTPISDPTVESESAHEPLIEVTAMPLDDSAIVEDAVEALPALVIDPRPAFPPEADHGSLRSQVAEELRREIWPVVYDEVRALVDGEVRPAVEAELRERLTAELRDELARSLRSELRDELYSELHEEVSEEIRAAEHAPIAAQVRDRLEEQVREELRRELWDQVRGEVKEDLSSVMRPALEAEVRQEMAGREAPKAAPVETTALASAVAGLTVDERGLGLGADDQLFIIRRLRERLAPALRDQFARELTDLAASLRDRESAAERERRLTDPEYCREQVRLYFFPDQPALWERVKPHVEPGRWQALVRSLAGGGYDRAKLERARPVVREALIVKAEIESELGSEPPRGVGRPPALAAALAGADRTLDFTLESLSASILSI